MGTKSEVIKPAGTKGPECIFEQGNTVKRIGKEMYVLCGEDTDSTTCGEFAGTTVKLIDGEEEGGYVGEQYDRWDKKIFEAAPPGTIIQLIVDED